MEHDADTNLNYAGARYYPAPYGRWLSQDPVVLAIGDANAVKEKTGQSLQKVLEDPQLLNSYSYAVNNPLRVVDTSGEWIEYIIGQQNAIALGDAGNYLYNNNSIAKAAFDHPIATGLIVGTGGGLAAYGGAAALTSLSVNYLGGIGTACLFNCSSIVQNAPKYAEQGYGSFNAFKNAVGKADPSGQNLRQWHHIVEQNPANRAQFGQETLQNAKNIVNIPTSVHQQISGYYSSIKDFTGGQTVRTWLSSQSFTQQAEFGRKILDQAVSGTLK